MVMESGFSSPRSEAFPAGLRVLVVDDDLPWLKILEKMLKKCSYEVTTSGLAREALKLLRDRKDGFDLVISDVNMPDMDGFKLLEHVGLEMDLPVIMMSVDGETSRVMKGVQHGACDYLLKPIRMKELKNIWQHVMRKRMREVRDIECIDDRNGTDPSNDGHYGGDQTLLRKRKDVENKHDEKDSSDSCSTKKARVVWTVELHQKFVNAVNQLGIDSDKEIRPKKILDLMNVKWLTRENVASHLQKYRLYLSRIQEEDKTENTFGAMKNPDHSPKESSGSFFQNSSFGQQNDVTSNCVHQGNQLPVHTVDSKTLQNDLKSSNSSPLEEHRKSLDNENSVSHRANNPQVGLKHIFGSSETSIDYPSFESPIADPYPWSGEVPDQQFEPKFKLNQSTVPILQQHIGADLLEPAPHINSGPSISESDNLGIIDIKLLEAKQCGNDIGQLSTMEKALESFSPVEKALESFSPMEKALESFSVSNPDAFGCVFDMPVDKKNQNSSQGDSIMKEQAPLGGSIQSFPMQPSVTSEPNFDVTFEMNQRSSQGCIIGQSSVNGSDYELHNQVLGSRSLAYGLLGEDLMFHLLHGGDVTSKGLGFDLLGFSDFDFPQHISEVPLLPYAPKFESEYPFDWVEYPVVDQGLLFS